MKKEPDCMNMGLFTLRAILYTPITSVHCIYNNKRISKAHAVAMVGMVVNVVAMVVNDVVVMVGTSTTATVVKLT